MAYIEMYSGYTEDVLAVYVTIYFSNLKGTVY